MVFFQSLRLGQDFEQGAPRWIVQPVALGNRLVHNRLYSLTDPAGGLRLAGPDGSQCIHDIGDGNGVNRLMPD